MTPGLSDTITRDRFRSWAAKLKPHTATPILAVAIGHGPHAGELHLVVVEDIPTDQVIGFLRHAIADLEGGAR